MKESNYQHFIRYNFPQHRQVAANAWRRSSGVTHSRLLLNSLQAFAASCRAVGSHTE